MEEEHEHSGDTASDNHDREASPNPFLGSDGIRASLTDCDCHYIGTRADRGRVATEASTHGESPK